MIKILMHGCNGKMGRMITEIAKQDQDVEIVAGVDLSLIHIYTACFAATVGCCTNHCV